MKKLSRNELKNVFGGVSAPPSDGPASCKCLPGDTGTCRTTMDGYCECTSTGSPSQYSLNDSTCKKSGLE